LAWIVSSFSERRRPMSVKPWNRIIMWTPESRNSDVDLGGRTRYQQTIPILRLPSS
jgi:hypothetical protein